MPGTSREIQLTTQPVGLPTPEHFTVVATPIPVPEDDGILVRNRFFHVSPALRSLIGGSLANAPFPGLTPGDTLYGKAIGEVVSAPPDAGVRPGDLVQHWLGWREYAAVPAGRWTPLDDTLPTPEAHLGQASIAYTALTRDARLSPGDTVFVSGGAGGIGSLAGQIARALGAGRVIGSTGSPDKAKRLVTELGYDAAVIRGTRPIADQLAEAAPDGIDVFLDNVGGEQLQAAIAVARPGARFAIVGTLSGQLSPDLGGTTAPVEIDTFQLIVKGIELRGFGSSAGDTTDPEWAERVGGWLRSGEMTFPHVRVAGMENAPRALHEMIGGRHLGTVLVEP
ncbi:MAG: MDR family NADP-dependent oxidoreductase [Spirillospora sp.]